MSERRRVAVGRPSAWCAPGEAVALASAEEREREERIVVIAISGYRKRRHAFGLLRPKLDREGEPK